MHFHSFILKPLVALLATSETQYFQWGTKKQKQVFLSRSKKAAEHCALSMVIGLFPLKVPQYCSLLLLL